MISEKSAPRLLGAMTKEAFSMTWTMARIAGFLYLSAFPHRLRERSITLNKGDRK